MKGLLLKEYSMRSFYYLVAELTWFLIEYFDVIHAENFSAWDSIISIELAYAQFVIWMFSVFDYRNKSAEYFLCLPYSKSQIVLSKFAIANVFPCLILFLDLIFLRDNISFLTIFICVSTIVLMPLYFSLGAKKGFGWILTIMVFGTVFLTAPAFLGVFMLNISVFVGFAIFAMLSFSSFILSVHLYKKRDI